MFKYRNLVFKVNLYIIILILFGFLFNSCTSCNNNSKTVKFIEDEIISSVYKYGICIDNYDITEDVIQPNQCLSNILSNYNISSNIIHLLSEKSKEIYDVRKLKSGNPYRLLFSRDSINNLHYLVYDISKVDYVVYCLQDSVYAYKGVLPTDTIVKQINGTIYSSLWNAMADAGASPELSCQLSDIYAWTIDFFGIQQGDSFDVIYEEIYVEDKFVGIGNILASKFTNSGKQFNAYGFIIDEKIEYFDEDGENLRSQFLKAPLSYKRISSKFSNARCHPITKKVRPHLGVDYAAPSGTPVYAIGKGVVIAKGWDSKGGGNYVKIKHNSVYTTLYMHLKGFANGLNKGKRVSQGELIGYVGSTGMSTGPHLDFRVYKNGKAIDPLKMENVPAEPVPDSLRNSYQKFVHKYDSLFNTLNVQNTHKIV
ncbi:MAG: peptidoglycan DD-metalloendopeptidase family protein [Bacteroidales bacterium]|jgi:murein DD-endopeptidase MepM/ murein hydrolase activator NlpD